MAGCRYSMRDASLRPRKHRPVRHLSEAATRLPQLPPSQPTIPNLRQNLWLQPSTCRAQTQIKKMLACSNRRSGRSRIAGSRIAAEADVPATGEMEGRAAGQASGDVHSADEGVGNPQRHGEEIHRRRDSADVANSGNSFGTSI